MGSELLATGSIVAAFFAGGVALFAPCCIVFLAPSYLAGAVKNRRWRLLPLTFVFAAGLAVVLVPLTLGMSLLAGAIARYHLVLYWAGGLMMIALAALALSGRMWSLPSFIRAPDTTRGDSASFFALGVFSGIASSCCAPVLAGVMTLSVLSGTPAGGQHPVVDVQVLHHDRRDASSVVRVTRLGHSAPQPTRSTPRCATCTARCFSPCS